MRDAVIRALGAFKAERQGDNPTSLRLYPGDWDKLRSEMCSGTNFVAVSPTGRQTAFGMIVLLDRKWPKGMPLALDASGAAEAIERGAFQA